MSPETVSDICVCVCAWISGLGFGALLTGWYLERQGKNQGSGPRRTIGFVLPHQQVPTMKKEGGHGA